MTTVDLNRCQGATARRRTSKHVRKLVPNEAAQAAAEAKRARRRARNLALVSAVRALGQAPTPARQAAHPGARSGGTSLSTASAVVSYAAANVGNRGTESDPASSSAPLSKASA